MNYEFHRVRCHPKLDLSGWYLVITHDAQDLLEQVHRSVAQGMFMRFHTDPHLYNQKTWKPTEWGQFYNPVRLAAGWIQSALDGLYKHGMIYVNNCGGLMFGESHEVFETCIRDVLKFPDAADHKDGVKITISRYGGCPHYYLRSNKTMLFSQDKFDTFDAAMFEAKQYAFENNIEYSESEFVYGREGD